MAKSIGFLREFLVLLTLSLLPAASAFAATGEAVGVIPEAEKVQGVERSVLAIGTDVGIGETISTGPAGQVELLFSDSTKLVIGPNANLLIEDYLLRSDGSAGSFAVSALSGTFRFFSGTMPKHSYKISTPTGTIGIRGTIFEFFVERDGRVLLTLLEGEVDLCPSSAPCETISIASGSPCSVGVMGMDGSGFADINQADFLSRFPYLESQEQLDPAFRVAQAGQCALLFKKPPEIAPASLLASPN